MALAVGIVRPPAATTRRLVTAGIGVILGLVSILGLGTARSGRAHASFGLSSQHVRVPSLVVPVRATDMALGVVCVLLGVAMALRPMSGRRLHLVLGVVLTLFVFAFLCWAAAGTSMDLVGLFSSTLARSIPLVLGALAGVLCERSGVIDVAIEGQLLVGAFAAAIVASAFGSLVLGLVGAAVAGGLLGLVLAVFAIRYLVDQVILGVVLNVLALGITGFLYDRVLVPYQNTLNSPATFGTIRVPVLSAIPIIGPVLFSGSVFLFLAYLLLVVIHVGLFHTRWGLRVRAVGEHPTAADTAGIRVLAVRYRNVVLGGFVAGLAGAYLTIGSVGAFGKNISSGKGFIALAALIFGRWTPFGALAAALLFGFADALQNILSILGAPIPSSFLLMAPYLATVLAVAGLVGRVRPPRADGKPYLKG